MTELKNVARYVTDKIDVALLNTPEYITTDNMIPNRGGVTECDSLPQAVRVTRYAPGDTLVSNIRPYFKKIWYADRVSGCSNDVIVFRPINENWDHKFLYYVLSQDAFFDHMMSGANGTKMPRGNKKTIPDFLVPDFDYEKQTRISETLSAYDDLIENNQKQIKLLEEAAQRLYKEWFVDFRFPGHENTRIVDGVPEGWEKDNLGGICELKKETVSAGQVSRGMPYIGLEHMPRVDFCLSSWGKADDVASNKYKYAENDIIFGKIRPYFHKVGFAINSGVVSTDSFVIKANNELWGLLLMTVFDKAFVDYTYKTCKEGAKMPRADWKQMEKYELLIPARTIRESFEEIVWNITRRIKSLAIQTRSLAEARDRLLPKLMNGEIEV